MDKLHIVTVATDSQYYFPYLVESCRKNGKELEVLGMGEVWQGFNWRYVKMMEYLRTLPTDDIVCFVDGYDVVCCRNLNELVDEFKEIKERTGCKIVTGDDKSSLFMSFLSFFFGTCNDNRINAGTYIGYVKDILEIIQQIYELNPRNDADDQVLMTQYCKKTKNEIYCDTENKLFLALCFPLEEIDKYVDIHENILTYQSNRPFFIHAPGTGYLENVIHKLGYIVENDNIQNELFRNILEKKILLYLKNYFLQNYIYFSIIIIFLIIYIFHFNSINNIIINFYNKMKTIYPLKNATKS